MRKVETYDVLFVQTVTAAAFLLITELLRQPETAFSRATTSQPSPVSLLCHDVLDNIHTFKKNPNRFSSRKGQLA